jgi:hypothetical protein
LPVPGESCAIRIAVDGNRAPGQQSQTHGAMQFHCHQLTGEGILVIVTVGIDLAKTVFDKQCDGAITRLFAETVLKPI